MEDKRVRAISAVSACDHGSDLTNGGGIEVSVGDHEERPAQRRSKREA